MLELQFCKQLESFRLDVDLKADNGAIALLGASGCGKSMTLKCIAGVEKPDRGRIVLDGRTLFDSEKGIDIPPQERKVGLLFQNYALFPTMTVQQNIYAGMRHLPKDARKQRCDSLISQFHLEGLEKRLPAFLSGGQQQRVALARMLASEPELLMFDEPFSALDTFLRWELEQTISEVVSDHSGTALFVSHNRDEAYRLCGKVAVMEEGNISVYKTRDQLFEQPETGAAARLIGCENIAPAQVDAMQTVHVAEWGIQLAVDKTNLASIRYIGIPASALKLGDGENTFQATVEKIIECPTSVILLVRKHRDAQVLRCEMNKQEGLRLSSGDVIRLFVESKDIWALK